MNIQRFSATTSREALAKARLAFGENTLILSNRQTEHGVEVVATAEDTLASLNRGPDSGMGSGNRSGTPSGSGSGPNAGMGAGFNAGFGASRQQPPAPSRPNLRPAREAGGEVETDAEQLSMSTLSFQDYVRERMANRKSEAKSPEIKIPTFPSEIRLPSAAEQAEQRISNFAQRAQVPSSAVQSIATTKTAAAQPAPFSAPFSTPLSGQTGSPRANLSAGIPTRPSASSAAPKSSTPTIANFDLAQELSAMKDMIEDRFNTLNWLGMARQNPIQSTLMVKLIRAGYSPMLARTILERIPEGTNAQNALQMVMNVLERNLQLDTRTLPEEGGFFAMIGATGVGKTTTIAKIAGICAQKYGASSLGLITLDTQRVGAQEQLRSHGKLLGTVTHVAHDRYALQELLNLLSNKRLVLIDTGGLAPRDPRKRDMMDLLDLPNIKRMLVLNAGGHGDTLDDTVAHFKGNTPQHVIFSKLDEAVKLGTVMDAAIRHRLILRGVTTGQQIPEDWESPNSRKLVLTSMIGTGKSPFDPKVADLSFMFSQGNNRPDTRNHLNA